MLQNYKIGRMAKAHVLRTRINESTGLRKTMVVGMEKTARHFLNLSNKFAVYNANAWFKTHART